MPYATVQVIGCTLVCVRLVVRASVTEGWILVPKSEVGREGEDSMDRRWSGPSSRKRDVRVLVLRQDLIDAILLGCSFLSN